MSILKQDKELTLQEKIKNKILFDAKYLDNVYEKYIYPNS